MKISNQDSLTSKLDQLFKDLIKEEITHKANLDFELLIQKLSLKTGITQDKLLSYSNLKDYYNKIWNSSFLDPYIQENFQNIIFHSSTLLQRDGEDFQVEDLSFDDYQLSLELLALKELVKWNYSSPFASFNCTLRGDSYRASLTHKSLHPQGVSKLYLRKIAQTPYTFNDFDACSDYFQEQIRLKKNIIVAGSTGSGKTSFTQLLLRVIPKNEHIVILEDAHELISQSDNFTHLIASNSKNKSLEEFCSISLRLSPKRIILGEIRSKEVIPFSLAMNTGHRGLITTIHADDAPSAIERLSLLYLLHSEGKVDLERVTQMMSKNIDTVIFLERGRIKEVIEILGAESGNCFYKTIFKKEESDGKAQPSLYT